MANEKSEVPITATENAGEESKLPPGYRFHPRGDEVLRFYLTPRIIDPNFSSPVMGDIDIYEFEPWDLPSRAKCSKPGETQWWFFSRRDLRYSYPKRKCTGAKRTTEKGFWKASGTDKNVFFPGRPDIIIGKRKLLVFYMGKSSKGGEKTSWMIHEYRLHGMLPSRLPIDRKDDWCVCRLFNKKEDSGAVGGANAEPVDEYLLDGKPPRSPLVAEETVGTKGAAVLKPESEVTGESLINGAHIVEGIEDGGGDIDKLLFEGGDIDKLLFEGGDIDWQFFGGMSNAIEGDLPMFGDIDGISITDLLKPLESLDQGCGVPGDGLHQGPEIARADGHVKSNEGS